MDSVRKGINEGWGEKHSLRNHLGACCGRMIDLKEAVAYMKAHPKDFQDNISNDMIREFDDLERLIPEAQAIVDNVDIPGVDLRR